MANHEWKELLPEEVEEKLKNGEPLPIVDVREPDEWFLGHIPGAKHIPLGQIPERIGELDKETETVFVCRSGGRSSRACEYLHGLGYKVINMPGGMTAWTGDKEFGE